MQSRKREKFDIIMKTARYYFEFMLIGMTFAVCRMLNAGAETEKIKKPVYMLTVTAVWLLVCCLICITAFLGRQIIEAKKEGITFSLKLDDTEE